MADLAPETALAQCTRSMTERIWRGTGRVEESESTGGNARVRGGQGTDEIEPREGMQRLVRDGTRSTLGDNQLRK
jgi:hypothetical protein